MERHGALKLAAVVLFVADAFVVVSFLLVMMVIMMRILTTFFASIAIGDYIQK